MSSFEKAASVPARAGENAAVEAATVVLVEAWRDWVHPLRLDGMDEDRLSELLGDFAEAVRAERDDIYELRERGLRILGDEQCCELACNGGACESCPCCCAGWCVSGHSGEIPERDLTPQSDYRIWLAEAAEHNPVAKLLAEIEGVAAVEYDEPADLAAAQPIPPGAIDQASTLAP